MGNNMDIIQSGIYKKGEVDLDRIIQSIKKHPKIDESGSILTFTGIVRKDSHDGRPVSGMKIDAYDELAKKSIEKICNEIKSEEGIIEIIVIHLKGEFEISEDLVYVVVASAHREKGFSALRNAVERYKKEIAVWKKEDFIDGTSEWVH